MNKRKLRAVLFAIALSLFGFFKGDNEAKAQGYFYSNAQMFTYMGAFAAVGGGLIFVNAYYDDPTIASTGITTVVSSWDSGNDRRTYAALYDETDRYLALGNEATMSPWLAKTIEKSREEIRRLDPKEIVPSDFELVLLLQQYLLNKLDSSG